MANFDADLDAEQMPVADRMDMEYTIYVNNLPIELKEEGIRDIFEQYGKITALFHPRNAIWAYITYGTYRQAELAIRELNDRKPLYLKVALAKERSSIREEQRLNISEVNFEKPKVVNTADSPPIHNNINYQCVGRGQLINIVHKYRKPQTTVSHRCCTSSSLPSSSQTSNIYETEDPCVTNELWTRGVTTVTLDGKRHVSLGRGYTLYQYSEPHPKIEECISKIYEQRNNGVYEHSEDKFKNKVQSCSVCSTKTTKHCEKCNMYYCSKTCQLEHWPHDMECEHIPKLVSDNELKSVLSQINQDVNQMEKTSTLNMNKTAKFGDVTLRRPNAMKAECVNSNPKLANQSVGRVTSTPEEFPQHRLRRYNIKNTEEPRNDRYSPTSSSSDQNHQSKSDLKRVGLKTRRDNNIKNRNNNDRKYPTKNGLSDKDSANYNGRENTNRQETSNNISVNNDLDFYKDTNFSKTKFITVEVIIPLNNSEYWVYKLEDTDARINLMLKLQDVTKKCDMPIIGEVYAVMYETLWHRARIISLNPVKVHFIDFGNDEILETNTDIRDIGDMIKYPKFARKICLAQGTSDKYRNLQAGEQISVRMLSIDSEKTIIVEVEEEQSIVKNVSSHTTESISNNTMKKSVPQENSKVLPNKSINTSIQVSSVLDTVIDLLTQKATNELEIDGFIQIHESTQKNVYNATFSPQIYGTEMEMIFNDMQNECTKIKTSCIDYKPNGEDLVCGSWNDGWYRGYISANSKTSSKPSIMAIDEARILPIDQILPCPKRFWNICAFGVMCEINHSTIKLQVGQIYEFTAIVNKESYKQQSLKIDIIVNSEIIEAVVSSWKSKNSSSLSELKNGSKICITSYRNHYCMFARSLEEADVEYYNNIMQSVAQCAQTAPHLTEPPSDSDIVIAPFVDGNNYRAMVLKTQNDKAKIVYIDFGNLAEIDIKDLKIMPQCHLQQQSCAAKVILKDVPRDIPMNSEVDIYLRNLLGKEVPLVYTFEDSSKDGVCLTTSTGECVNDKINQLLIPGWKREDNDDNTCYMLSDIKVASLGRVGETLDAVVLFVREDNRTTYMMGPLDIELITHVFETMPAMLQEYCEKMEYYIPRTEELCLALYDGAWYRAACLNPKESYTTSQILFIDYGNIESIAHKDIRLMPKDFIIPAAIANLCTVVNLAPVDSDGKYSKAVQKKLEELVLPNSSVKIKIVECLENGDYKIELPNVHAALIKDGLV